MITVRYNMHTSIGNSFVHMQTYNVRLDFGDISKFRDVRSEIRSFSNHV